MKRSRLVPALLVAALLPAGGVTLRAFAGGPPRKFAPPFRIGDDSAEEARARVLSAMATDSSVLINVTGRELPASPDILNLGQHGTKALERCLSDNVDAGVRLMCATLLGRLGDRHALGPLRVALDDWDPGVRGAVIRALGDIPDAASFDPLMKLYRRGDEEPQNHVAILATLGGISSPKAVQVLRKELRHRADDEGVDARQEAFRALWRSRHLMARPTLVEDVAYALGSDNAGLVLGATAAASELRAPRLVKALIPLLQHQNAEVRNKAVYALGRIGDTTATKVLLGALPKVREARMLNNIAFALERLDRAAFYGAIKDVIKHKQAIIRLNAAFVLGDVRRPEGLPLLAQALDDASDYVRTSAIVALGKLGTSAAQQYLERFVDDANLSIRQEAIYALHALSGGKRTDLIFAKLLGSKNEATRRRAAIALGAAGDPRVRDYLLACFEARRCSREELDRFLENDQTPQLAGRLLLLWARGRRDVTDLIAKKKPAGTLAVAESSIEAAMARNDVSTARSATDLVGDVGSADGVVKEPLVAELRKHTGAPQLGLRLRAQVALARLGDGSVDATLMSELDNMAQDALPAFAHVLGRIDEPAVRARLSPALVEREKSGGVNVALAAAATLLRWDPDRAFFRFLDALASPSVRERDLAERYLRRNRGPRVTWLMRRALARESREYTRDRLRELLDNRS